MKREIKIGIVAQEQNQNLPKGWLQLVHVGSCFTGLRVVLCEEADLKEGGHNPVVLLRLQTTLVTNQHIKRRAWAVQ